METLRPTYTAQSSPPTVTHLFLSAWTTTPSWRLELAPMKKGEPSSARTELPAAMWTWSPSTTRPITEACRCTKAVRDHRAVR
jgi:hypothetical protein